MTKHSASKLIVPIFALLLTGIINVTKAINLPAGPNINGVPASGTGLPGALINVFFPLVLVLLGFVAIYYIVVSAMRFILSRGNPEQVAEARSRLIWAIVGFVILLLSLGTLQVINNIFLGSNVVN